MPVRSRETDTDPLAPLAGASGVRSATLALVMNVSFLPCFPALSPRQQESSQASVTV